MSVIIYTRTSTKGQTAGHDAQRDECTEWAQSQGLDVKGVYSDTISGATELADRDGFTLALSNLEKGDVLVTWSRDRLGRTVLINAVGQNLINAKGASYHSLDAGSADTPEQVLLVTLLDAFAQFERERTRMRTRSALKSKKERGLCIGNTKHGETKQIKDDGLSYVVRDDDELTKINSVKEWRSKGLTLREIAEKCKATGIVTRTGNAPSISVIASWVEGVEFKAKPKAIDRAKLRSRKAKATIESKNAGLAELIKVLRGQGMKWNDVAQRVNASGYRNSKGNELSVTQIIRVHKRTVENECRSKVYQ